MTEVGILDAIQEQINIERSQILDAASEKAEKILKKAQDEVDLINSGTASVKARGQDEVRVSPVVLQAKQAGMEKAFARAIEQLAQLRSKPEYPAILKTLMLEAYDGLSGDVDILVNAADVELAKKVAAELQISGKVVSTTDFDGGVTLSKDGKAVNHNSFVSRVANVKTLFSGKVASILYA